LQSLRSLCRYSLQALFTTSPNVQKKLSNNQPQLKTKIMDKIQKLKYRLQYETEKVFADLICKKENTEFTEAYKSGLIAPIELIKNSMLKDLYKNCKPIK
jgi:hypothetical protein